MNLISFLEKLEGLIGKGKLEKVLEVLQKVLKASNSPLYEDVIQQSAHFQKLQQDMRLRIITTENSQISFSKLTNGILGILKDCKEDDSCKNFFREADVETLSKIEKEGIDIIPPPPAIWKKAVVIIMVLLVIPSSYVMLKRIFPEIPAQEVSSTTEATDQGDDSLTTVQEPEKVNSSEQEIDDPAVEIEESTLVNNTPQIIPITSRIENGANSNPTQQVSDSIHIPLFPQTSELLYMLVDKNGFEIQFENAASQGISISEKNLPIENPRFKILFKGSLIQQFDLSRDKDFRDGKKPKIECYKLNNRSGCNITYN